MQRITMTILISIIAIIVIAILTGKKALSNQHSKEVSILFSLSGDIFQQNI